MHSSNYNELSGNDRLFVFHWWLLSPFVHSYKVRKRAADLCKCIDCTREKRHTFCSTCGGVFCLSEFFVMAFSV
ncbi:hypothetical protein T07_9435, partial [Trichinella nelsoni]